MIKRIFGIFWVITLLLSCQTGKPIKRLSNEGMMYAMIYDYENVPVSGVAVSINEKKIVDSDIQGRFILDTMKKGEYRVKLTKKGYETLEESFQYDPMQVLYFKIINTQQLLVLAETALDNTEYVIAENYLDRALLLEPNRPDILFLKSIACYFQSKNAEAAAILEKMIISGNNDPSISQLLEKVRQVQTPEE
jgi:tetratricopeptide (TPR) repeat protein